MKTEKPQIVRKAILLLWLSLGVGIIRTIIELPRLTEEVAVVGGVWFA